MNETVPENLLDSRYKTTAAIYFAMIFSSVALVIAAFFFADGNGSIDKNTLMPLWIAIVFTAIASFVLRRVMSGWDGLKNAKLLKGFGGVFSKLQTNSIILGALAESIAVAGFVIAALGGNPFDAVRAGAVSVIVFLINFPRKSVWRKIAENLEKV